MTAIGEHPVGVGGAEKRAVPVVADGKLIGEAVEDGQGLAGIVTHDHSGHLPNIVRSGWSVTQQRADIVGRGRRGTGVKGLVGRDKAAHLSGLPLPTHLGSLVRRIEEVEPNVVQRPGLDAGIGIGVVEMTVGRQLTSGQPLDVHSVFRGQVESAQVVVEGTVLHHHEHEVLDLLHAHCSSSPAGSAQRLGCTIRPRRKRRQAYVAGRPTETSPGSPGTPYGIFPPPPPAPRSRVARSSGWSGAAGRGESENLPRGW